MTAVWQVIDDGGAGADERERALFADLDAVLALPFEPAGPPNRLRSVRRIAIAGRIWFLKVFTATQPKNRLRFALTRPRARNDAGRELRVTQALRAAGFAAPRPVAFGCRGATSFYLCAELAGRPLADWLATPDAGQGLADRAARFCGGLLAAGFRLPDLSPDHVFVDGERFAVLDLHNGGIGGAGPPPARLLRRVLRRFARAARGTPAAGRPALRFAVRLLRAAGRRGPRARRTLLAALPPLSTAARYEAHGKSAAYAGRNRRRAAREAELLRRVWPGRAGESVLDVPCGAARLLPWLSGECGHTVTLADGALAMLREAAHAHPDRAIPERAVAADALALPFAADAFDGVVQFRFLHHLPDDAARTAIAETCRIARRFVVVSFFHRCSFHHLRRRFGALRGRPPTRFARTLAAVRADFERHGFRLERTAADLPFARDLWLASFVRAR